MPTQMRSGAHLVASGSVSGWMEMSSSDSYLARRQLSSLQHEQLR